MAGYDVGNQNCTVTVLSKLETTNLVNHDLYYTMPSELPFDDEHNLYSFFNISLIKWLLGRKFTDSDFQSYLQTFPLKVTQHTDGFPLIHGRYTRKEVTFTPTQLLAELISLLKLRAQENLKLETVDCCIAVPVYFGDVEKRAFFDAATRAGLKPRMILHEMTATALAYAFRKNDFCENNERNVAFVDMGQMGMQVCIAKFQKGKLEVLSHASDTSLGGRNFDEVLFKYLANKHKIDVQNNVRASFKLLQQCEGLKASLSSNPRVEFTIDSSLAGKEIKGFITRKHFNWMSKSLLERVNNLLVKALKDASLSVENIGSVELVGLGSFMPVINRILTRFFRQPPIRSMKTGKCIAMGCAIQCALLANASQLKGFEFQVHDILPYSISLSWKVRNGIVRKRKDFFTKGAPIPSEKYLTLLCAATFSLDIFYFDDAGDSEIPLKIRTYEIGPFCSSSGQEVAVRVRVQLNINGIVLIASANVMEEEREFDVPVCVKLNRIFEERISTKRKEVVSVKEYPKTEPYAESSQHQHAQKIQVIKATKRRKQQEALAKKRTKHGSYEKFLGKSSSIEVIRKGEEEELEQNQRKKKLLELGAPIQVKEIQTSLHAKIQKEAPKIRLQHEKLCSDVHNEKKTVKNKANSALLLFIFSLKSYLDAINEKSIPDTEPELQLTQAESELQIVTVERELVANQVEGPQNQFEEGQASSSKPSNKGVPNYCEFTHLELKEATFAFDKKNIVGEGAYSTVYKGLLHRTPVAIKKLTIESRHALKEFIQEVEICSKVRHPHLITLIGACEEPRALVLELMPNGSLEDRLSRKNNTRPIPWYFRIRIALEVCTALIFLHSIKPHGLAYGDFKTTNILLDSTYRSKLSGFGTVRPLINIDDSLTPYHDTDLLHGTPENMAPEYFSTGVLTAQCDVYSFGLVLLQLVTGKMTRLLVQKRNVMRLRDWVQEEMRAGRLNGLVDPSAGQWPHASANKMIRLGLRCSEASREERLDLAQNVWDEIKSMEEVAFAREVVSVRC